jgi:aspartyl protease family protein
MWRYVVVAILLVTLASLLPERLQHFAQSREAGVRTPPPATDAGEPRRDPLAGRFARIEADKRGHFVADARLNGRRYSVLVDTGATLVAINRRTARRIGLRLSPHDFNQRIRTANGIATAASVQIDEITLGRVRIRDVDAAVLSDDALSTVLLGASFLGRLKSYRVEDGVLMLKQ